MAAFPPVVAGVPEGFAAGRQLFDCRCVIAFGLVDDAEFASAGGFPSQVAEGVGGRDGFGEAFLRLRPFAPVTVQHAVFPQSVGAPP
ncbi:hypothetical protein [Amycolatopsis panacis]|uniref:Uncharacterized protein n=1 Tax=Amycolatopsis panacis TaxID=2340917 RepID=A0A419HPU6_9PSEU|nr:hypothetical protein [Amycolatopsis panacis]RJQ78382.1 hypothetical protein D5S19_28400 [Amycolatopsis panacis]